MEEIIDFDKEKERLEKEKKTALSEIERVERKLNNAEFVAKAPQKVIDGEREKLDKYQKMLENIEEQIAKVTR